MKKVAHGGAVSPWKKAACVATKGVRLTSKHRKLARNREELFKI